ncbi:hypothetical protein VTO42DRAFT_2326 [Malbranchea cinnamomea]
MTSSSEASDHQSQTKRKAAVAGLPGAPRPIKRRASKACCCCRARKVRCDVVENGVPCTNCRLDEVECIVTESKRRKKTQPDGDTAKAARASDASEKTCFVSFGNNMERSKHPSPSVPDPLVPVSPSQNLADPDSGRHVPHLIYQRQSQRIEREDQQRRMSSAATIAPGLSVCPPPLLVPGFGQLGCSPPPHVAKGVLPAYIRPLPAKFQEEDINYLHTKGALSIPNVELRNELLKSYIQYVHSYMPLLELDDFLSVIVRNDATRPLSLLLFQAVMFAGTAFIDMKHLRAAGFESRKVARKAFFQKARLLYDFDYEVDRISLVQSLLLMTHWYEMPDDQKDTWHWMGVSLSLAHTIGLHRNPANSSMDVRRQKLWKRIWWSIYTRDRLIALGMRRPTRIKDEDCDVPLLTIDDFDFKPFSPEVIRVVGDCEMVRNVVQQKELATMFVEKAKLCLCISHVLSAQYSVLSHKFGGTTETTMMLVPKKGAAETCEVRKCDDELETWLANLPEVAHYRPPTSSSLSHGEEVLHLHRAILKMIYYTTSSALHRPQVLPATPNPNVEVELQMLSRTKVRQAAVEITNIAQDLHTLDLVRYLPTTGVTVLLPAVIIHLLDIKSNDLSIRNSSLHRFYQCMQILSRLREIYASADFATQFLEAAIRKAGIQIATQTPTREKPATINPVTVRPDTLTPPPDATTETVSDTGFTMKPSIPSFPTFPPTNREPDLLFASTPPHSVGSENGSTQNVHNDSATADLVNSSNNNNMADTDLAAFMNLAHDADITQNDLDALINFDDAGADLFTADDGSRIDFGLPDAESKIQLDINWMRDFGLTSRDTNNDSNGGDVKMQTDAIVVPQESDDQQAGLPSLARESPSSGVSPEACGSNDLQPPMSEALTTLTV